MTTATRTEDHHSMTSATRTANLLGVVVPFVGVLVAIVLLWNSWVGTQPTSRSSS